MTLDKEKIQMVEFDEVYAGFTVPNVALFHEDRVTEKMVQAAIQLHPQSSPWSDRVLIMTQFQYANVFLAADPENKFQTAVNGRK
jgi:hypothetical protein